MGCSPLGKMVAKAFSKCTGKEAKSSPPPSYFYSRPRTVAKSVNFTTAAPIIIIPPDSSQTVTMTKPLPAEIPANRPSAAPPTTTTRPGAHAAMKETARVRFEEPDRDRVVGGSEANASGAIPAGPVQGEPSPAQRCPPNCYVMSPLPRWEEMPRRKEYFSAEYNYYPTPIREGIYNIATDPNRLSTIFSEENPNACSIV